MMNKLQSTYFQQDAVTLARDLIGKILVRKLSGKLVQCKIIETEAYMGIPDKASHAYRGKRTPRTEPLFHKGGIAYIYTIYGIYECFNIVVNNQEKPESVFLRSVEPLDHMALLRKNRPIKNQSPQNLTNGPSKLCMALKIDKTLNGLSLVKCDDLYILPGDNKPQDVEATPRINIDYAAEFTTKKWRFFLKNNRYISK